MANNSWTRGLANIASFQLGAFAGLQASLRIALHQRPMPMPHQMGGLLEHPLRKAYRNPIELLGACGIAPGETVLDVGCGTGLFTEEIARLVGANGIVHAVDFQPSLLSQTADRLAAAGVAERVQLHLCHADKLPLADESVDMVALIAALGEMADPIAVIDELCRVLKPEGRLVISEELLDAAYVSAPTVRRWLTDGGLRFAGRQGNVFCYYELYFK